MLLRGSKSNIIIGLLTLILLGFLLFVSVYNQIIVQNEGFFYMIAFGGILILAYILLGLMTKLIAISPQVEDNFVWNILETLVYIGFIVLFVFSRIKYSVSAPVNEELFYKTASFFVDGTIKDSLDVVTKLIGNAPTYVYGMFSALIFKLFGSELDNIIYLNCFLLVVSAFFAGKSTRKIGGRLCGIIVAASVLFVPSQSFAVYSFDSELIVSAILFISLYLYLCIVTHQFKYSMFSVIISILCGLFTGLLLFSEPLMLMPFLLMSIFLFISKRHDIHEGIISVFLSLISFFFLLFGKSLILDVPFSDILKSVFSRFAYTTNDETGSVSVLSDVFSAFLTKINNQSAYIIENYYVLTGKYGQNITDVQAAWLQLTTQLIFMFFLVLSIGCCCYLIRLRNPRIIPVYILLFGSTYILFVRAVNDSHTFYFFILLMISGSSALNYMYENHHPDLTMDAIVDEYSEYENINNDENIYSQEDYERQQLYAEAMIFIGENEPLYQKLKEEDREISLQMLNNRPEVNDEAVLYSDNTYNIEDNSFENEAVNVNNIVSDISDNEYYDSSLEEEYPLPGEPLKTPTPLPQKANPKPLDFDDEINDAQLINDDIASVLPVNNVSEKNKKSLFGKNKNKKKEPNNKAEFTTEVKKDNVTKHLDGIDTSNNNGQPIILSDEYFDFDINDDSDDFDDFDV